MDLRDKTVLILGGAGLVGIAVARKILESRPKRIVLGSLRKGEVDAALVEVRDDPRSKGVKLEGVWGDLFVPHQMKDRPRADILSDPEALALLVDDIYGELTEEVFHRSTLGRLLEDTRPRIIVDCINTAGALAYQDVFRSAAGLRERAASGAVDAGAVDTHLATLYLPQLIRGLEIDDDAHQAAECVEDRASEQRRRNGRPGCSWPSRGSPGPRRSSCTSWPAPPGRPP